MHKQKWIKPQRCTNGYGINDLCQADLVEVIPLARYNEGYCFIMAIINCFSKYAYAVPLKTKLGWEIAENLEPILCADDCHLGDLNVDLWNQECCKQNVFK